MSKPLSKTGLDDFLVQQGADALDRLIQDTAQPLTIARPLWRLNEQVVYVRDPGLVLVRETGQKLTPAAFKDHAFSHAEAPELTVKPNGDVSMRMVPAAPVWLKWPLRAEANVLAYEPGKPAIVSTDRGSGFNMWRGLAVEPKKGDVKPFLQLLAHVFGKEEAGMAWFKKWLAYPLQNLGIKLYSASVLHGRHTGTGKTAIGYTVGAIYGRNFTEIKQSHLHGDFNGWAEDRQFILADDITGGNTRAEADALKKLITQLELWVNNKHIAAYLIRDCINYLFTSNQVDAFFLEDTDRRFFIHEVMAKPLPDTFYTGYWKWVKGGGAAALLHYLLELDTSDFNPAGHALRTAAKDRMIADVRSDVGQWIRDVLENPDHYLRMGTAVLPGDLFTSKQLLALYDPDQRGRVGAVGITRELKRAGCVQMVEGKVIKGPDGVQDRFFALRNRERWENASEADVRAHLIDPKGTRPKTAAKKRDPDTKY